VKKNYYMLILNMILIIYAMLPICQSGFAQNDENKYTLKITIHKIRMIDLIENPPQPEYVDWHYFLTINYGGQSICENVSYEKCFIEKYVDRVHEFEVNSKIIRFYIDLVDEDVYTRRDLADISGHLGGGMDDYEGFTRGTRFSAIYYAVNNRLLDADNFTQSSGYFIISGEYDGSSGTDENDAEMWFSIWDNYDPPKADAGPDRHCYLGRTVSFDGANSSASEASRIIRYEWDLNNDGEFELFGSNTNYIFNNKGKYNISLRVTDSFGEIDTDTCSVYVDDSPPLSSFTYFPANPTMFDTIRFNDTSVDVDGYVKSRFWDFGDGANSTERNPSHIYAEKGTHCVILVVEDNTGKMNSSQLILNIKNIPPVADFTYSPNDPDKAEEITFKDMANDPDGKILRYKWDFGDGHTSNNSNAIHSYDGEGRFVISLTVTDEEGESDTVQKIVNVIQRHDLTITIRDVLGFKVSNAEVEIYSEDTGLMSKTTKQSGDIVLSNTPQGLYEVKVKILGITTSAFYPLTSSTMESITVPLSYYTLGFAIGIITIISITVFYILKGRK